MVERDRETETERQRQRDRERERGGGGGMDSNLHGVMMDIERWDRNGEDAPNGF